MKKIGVFDQIDADAGSLAAQSEWHLKLIEGYDRTGIEIDHLGEPYSTPSSLAPSPSVLRSALAQRNKRLGSGPRAYTLPLHHPLGVMDKVAMLARLRGRRIELDVGRSR